MALIINEIRRTSMFNHSNFVIFLYNMLKVKGSCLAWRRNPSSLTLMLYCLCASEYFTRALHCTRRWMGAICHSGWVSAWWSEYVSRVNAEGEPCPVSTETCNSEWIKQGGNWKGSWSDWALWTSIIELQHREERGKRMEKRNNGEVGQVGTWGVLGVRLWMFYQWYDRT